MSHLEQTADHAQGSTASILAASFPSICTLMMPIPIKAGAENCRGKFAYHHHSLMSLNHEQRSKAMVVV